MEAKILSAGVIPVIFENGKASFLLLRSFKYWDFPKGEVDAGEDPAKAAIRELMEETGLTQFKLPFGKEFVETEPYSKGKVARYYIAEVFSKDVVLGVNPELGKPEHDEYRWVSALEARALLGERVLKVLKWATSKLDGNMQRL